MIVSDVTTYNEQATQTTGRNDQIGKEAFLTLLLAQLSCQDPLDPMDNMEFTSQLSQFSQLEQMVGLNEKLNELLLYQSSLNSWQGVGMIDREVDVLGDWVKLDDGVPGMIGCHLDQDCGRMTVRIYDPDGKPVRTLDEGPQPKGEHLIEWDGKGDGGTVLPDGRYTVTVTVGEDGEADMIDTFVRGIVTGMSFGGGIPLLLMGDEAIPFASVMQVRGIGQG